MRQIILVAGSCALLGGLAGGGIVLWLMPQVDPSSVGGEVRSAEPDPQLHRRVESVEQAVRSLQARGAAVPRAGLAGAGSAPQGSAAAGEPGAAEPAPVGAAIAPGVGAPLVGDPVFEAAVLDVIERAEEDRDSQRDVRRSERARQQAEHWTRELTERLGLSSEQAAKLLEIRTQLAADLRERRGTEGGRFVPREQRRAEREALRGRAEEQLRGVLRAEQVARYDDLEDELKIVRPPDAD